MALADVWKRAGDFVAPILNTHCRQCSGGGGVAGVGPWGEAVMCRMEVARDFVGRSLHVGCREPHTVDCRLAELSGLDDRSRRLDEATWP